MNAMTDSLVSALSAQIERVSSKAQRWRGYLGDLAPQEATGTGWVIKIMEADLDVARHALRTGDIETMTEALRSLKGYNDD